MPRNNNPKYSVLADDNKRFDFIANRHGDKLFHAHKENKGPMADQSPPPTPHEMAAYLSGFDPHPRKAYSPWIAGHYVKRNLRDEDLPGTHDNLHTFMNSRAINRGVDINRLSPGDLWQLVTKPEASPEHISNDERGQRFIKNGEAHLIYSDAANHVVNTLTHKANQHFGSGTNWCTIPSESNMNIDGEHPFTHYHKQGPLYIIKYGPDRSMLHVESNQWKDEKNNDVHHKLRDEINAHPLMREIEKHWVHSDEREPWKKK